MLCNQCKSRTIFTCLQIKFTNWPTNHVVTHLDSKCSIKKKLKISYNLYSRHALETSHSLPSGPGLNSLQVIKSASRREFFTQHLWKWKCCLADWFYLAQSQAVLLLSKRLGRKATPIIQVRLPAWISWQPFAASLHETQGLLWTGSCGLKPSLMAFLLSFLQNRAGKISHDNCRAFGNWS